MLVKSRGRYECRLTCIKVFLVTLLPFLFREV